MTSFRQFGLLLVLSLLAACAAAGTWKNADLPKSQWPRDEAACRRFAGKEADKRYANDQSFSQQGGVGQSRTHTANMARYEAVKYRRSVFSHCMKGRGYSLVKSGG
ncbi:MAG: hypothetical protein ISR52_07695 [Rhodospirillales bacterium]|nr:hypothetical protein [Rhodospirillales bacterium]